MRAVIQRVTSASVDVDGQTISRIGPGLLCLIGIHREATPEDAAWLARKLCAARIFPSADGGRAWDRSVADLGDHGEVLLVSQVRSLCPSVNHFASLYPCPTLFLHTSLLTQFTLYGRVNKGNRPDFSHAMGPGEAEKCYADFVGRVRAILGEDRVEDGKFGAMMEISLVNDGPVTLTIEPPSAAI